MDEAFLEPSARGRPLCIVLDGSLVSTRLGSERVALLFRQRPWVVFALPFWLAQGPNSLRRRLARGVRLNPVSLPYRQELLAALKLSREAGRQLVLIAPDAAVGESVSKHLGLFQQAYTNGRSDDDLSLGLTERLQQSFPGGFDYVGHSAGDAVVLAKATQGYLIGASPRALDATRTLPAVRVISRRPSVLKALVAELRPHQWAKNALVVLPVLLAPDTPSLPTLARALLAAGTFSLCASAGYVFNDLLDLEADRVHASKAKRPFASGALPIILGFPLFLALLLIGFSLASAWLPAGFAAMLALYFVGTVSYSLFLKRVMLLDVLVLAGLYTHRIVSGGIATGVHVSTWLLGFSMFLFTSLAFAKRFVELHAMSSDGKVKNRGYFPADLPMVTSMGTASGYIAALVFMLYVDSSAVRASYREPGLLWLVLPALLYWLGRIWLLAGRGQMQEDPVKFALRDRWSLACVAIIGLIAVIARFTPPWLVAILH